MSDEISHSQQTMNQDNKISSVRHGTINIELGLDLYVLLYYRGLRSVDDIYRLHSTVTSHHIPKITASPVCTAITRSSADADNRLDAFSGQSRSTNMVPFHM